MKATDISPEIIMLIGVPGSGKSNYVKQLIADYPEKNYVLLSTDDLLAAWGEAEGLSYSEAFDKYMKRADQQFKIQFRQAKNTNSNIIIDRTNLTTKGRAKLLSQLPKEYYKTAVVFNIERDELDKRLAKREIETGKKVPDRIVTNMINSYRPPTNAEFDEIKHV